jgi:CIC family chloride channel protein
MWLRWRRKHLARVPDWVRPSLGGLVTWLLGSAVFLQTGRLGVFSLGYGDLSDGLGLHLGWKLAGLLLVAKLLATVSCYGLGGCGGIFSPTLFLGGMCGICLAGLWGIALPLNGSDQLALAVVGMSACLGAVVRAPVTGILIVFEMTHEFSLVPALMIGALLSQTVSRKLNRFSFYEQILVQDGHRIEHVVPPRDLQTWQQMPLSTIANFQPVTVPDLAPLTLEKLLRYHPYQRFPVSSRGAAPGILTRKEIESALRDKREPRAEPAPICLPRQSIRELQRKLIESPSLMALVLDRPEGHVIALVTLHDLLRAEVAMAKDDAQ